jgi:hypothetical protein
VPTRGTSAKRARSSGKCLLRWKPSRDLRSLYRKHFSSARKERVLLSTAGFLSTFAAARAVTHAIRAGRGPFHNIGSGGRHIHHMTFGILGLLLTGFLWINEVGFGRGRHHRLASRLTSSTYGAGAALTLDEFALWLNLEDDYWSREGRKSIDAVAIFASLLILALLGTAPVRELLETANAPRRVRFMRRAWRLVRHHPQTALELLARR